MSKEILTHDELRPNFQLSKNPDSTYNVLNTENGVLELEQFGGYESSEMALELDRKFLELIKSDRGTKSLLKQSANAIDLRNVVAFVVAAKIAGEVRLQQVESYVVALGVLGLYIKMFNPLQVLKIISNGLNKGGDKEFLERVNRLSGHDNEFFFKTGQLKTVEVTDLNGDTSQDIIYRANY